MPTTAMRSYKDLEVWQVAMSLAVSCYRFTSSFPREKQFGLTAQVRRSAASIAANITEGYGRESTANFIHFLRIAQGSQKELETHLILATRVGLLSSEQSETLLAEVERVSRMLRNLIRALQAKT